MAQFIARPAPTSLLNAAPSVVASRAKQKLRAAIVYLRGSSFTPSVRFGEADNMAKRKHCLIVIETHCALRLRTESSQSPSPRSVAAPIATRFQKRLRLL